VVARIIGRSGRPRRLAVLGGLAASLAAVAVAASGAFAASGTPIKIGILSDCQGAFGPFYDQDIGGAQAALAELGLGKPKDPNKPSAGFVGGSVGGHPIQIVGYGCSNDRADTAIKETRRLMEQLGADILIGPLSGDESIAVANYAKQHPTKTFINGTAGAMDATLKVRAKNFYRFYTDGAQWSAGLGDWAYKKLHWKKAAVIMDDYSFAWTSAAGFIADFCGAGGQVTKRVFPPLNTTDYSSYAQQLPDPSAVDGYFWAVGGTGLIPSLKAFEAAHGPIDGKKFIGNLFWGTPGQYQALSSRVAGAYLGQETAGDSNTPAVKKYTAVLDKWYKKFPPFPGSAGAQGGSVFVYNYYNGAWALGTALKKLKGNMGNGQAGLQQALRSITVPGAFGTVRLDAQQSGISNNYIQQLYTDKSGHLAVKTVAVVPNVDETLGGTFKPGGAMPSRTNPPCVKRQMPWAGKIKTVNFSK
jgi:branched-chain amino acid transport system substrate-binding protein